MSTYPMDIPLFSLHLVTIGLLLSYDKGDGIWGKIHWGAGMGQQLHSKVENGGRTNLHLYMIQC